MATLMRQQKKYEKPDRFLSDRKADHLMWDFVRLTEGCFIEECRVSSALRTQFFADCLRTQNYLRYGRKDLAYRLAPYSFHIEFRPAEVLFVREGLSKREDEQLRPITDWLSARSCRVEVAFPPHLDRFQRIAFSVGNYLTQGSAFRQVSKWGNQLDEIVLQLQRHFDLAPPLADWFRLHLAMCYRRYEMALRMLDSLKPCPRVLVFASEHHPFSSAALSAARKRGIPTVLIQHGFLGQEWLHWPIEADRLCVFGEVDRRWFAERGLLDDRIAVTGSPKATSIDQTFRETCRARCGLGKDRCAVTFFAPNLDRHYHRRAAEFLAVVKERLGAKCEWFVRLHPSQENSRFQEEYAGFRPIPSSVPLKEAYAITDLVLHDYSTMAFAQYAGIRTACLALDPPYPSYYDSLLGEQPRITQEVELFELILSLCPGYALQSRSCSSMAAGDDEAAQRIGNVICTMMEA